MPETANSGSASTYRKILIGIREIWTKKLQVSRGNPITIRLPRQGKTGILGTEECGLKSHLAPSRPIFKMHTLDLPPAYQRWQLLHSISHLVLSNLSEKKAVNFGTLWRRITRCLGMRSERREAAWTKAP
mmetsp:Transcript_5823/g.11558  ORF Transcript_5823/g.11558 Transcript_5823/m.11558 type:complete len:130 (+) Transcript_5823:362-751(+)